MTIELDVVFKGGLPPFHMESFDFHASKFIRKFCGVLEFDNFSQINLGAKILEVIQRRDI